MFVFADDGASMLINHIIHQQNGSWKKDKDDDKNPNQIKPSAIIVAALTAALRVNFRQFLKLTIGPLNCENDGKQ